MSNIRQIRSKLEEIKRQGTEVTLSLYQVNINGYKIPIGRLLEWSDPEETTTWAMEQARNYSNGMGSTQRYLLTAYAVDDLEKQSPIMSVAFKVAPEQADANDGDNALSEPPSSVGLLSQLMRHNQEMHKQMSGMIGALTMHMARTIEKQSEQIEKLSADRSLQLNTMEDLMSRKHERDLEMKKEESKVLFQKEMYGKVMQLLPIVVNKIAGKEIVHQKDTTFEAVTTEFLSSLTPTKLDAMADSGLLDRNQLLMLTTMLEQASKRMITVEQKAELAQQAQGAKLNGL